MLSKQSQDMIFCRTFRPLFRKFWKPKWAAIDEQETIWRLLWWQWRRVLRRGLLLPDCWTTLRRDSSLKTRTVVPSALARTGKLLRGHPDQSVKPMRGRGSLPRCLSLSLFFGISSAVRKQPVPALTLLECFGATLQDIAGLKPYVRYDSRFV